MSCSECNKESNDSNKKLIEEGREFTKKALSICSSCENLTLIGGIKKCSICGCLVRFKIISNSLIKSKCPINKW